MFRVHHEKHWAGRSTSWNQIAGRNINNLRHADDTTLMAESEEELQSLWFWYQYSAYNTIE